MRTLPGPIMAVISACLCSSALCGATIRFSHVETDKTLVPRGSSFILRMAAVGEGVPVRSYRVRTPYKVTAEHVPPGFRHEGGYAVFAGTDGAILDNAEYDLDKTQGAVAVEINTAGFPEGVNYLVAFAHNRPGGGSHVLDYRNIRLDVGPDTVKVRVLGGSDAGARDPVEFTLPHGTVQAGQPLTCGVRLAGATDSGLSIRLRPPYTWGPAEILPGFTYDAEEKVGYLEDAADHTIADNGKLDTDPTEGSIRVTLPTTGWPAGAHFLSLEIADRDRIGLPYGLLAGVYRDFVVSIPGASDHLEVQVGPSEYLADGTHFGSLVSLGEGRVLAEGLYSEDYGQTWRKTQKAMPRPNLLSDGSLIAMSYRALPVEGQKGVYRGQLWLSEDGGLTVQGPLPSKVVVPKARAAMGHGPHVGPLFGRSIVELSNGDLISAMYGWFEGDTEPDKYRAGGTMRRSYICRSSDRGRSWEYLSTVAYRPFLGNEGYSELVIRKLPNDDIYALVRTGGNSNPGAQDNPLMMSRSGDDGRTWQTVERTGVEGCWPDLCVMHDGTLVCSTGRPGAFIMFSLDNGATWADITPIDAERYSGYTAVCEVRPGELLVGYGARNWYDPGTGRRSSQLRLRRVRVRRR